MLYLPEKNQDMDLFQRKDESSRCVTFNRTVRNILSIFSQHPVSL
jgi:hypothetical protein